MMLPEITTYAELQKLIAGASGDFSCIYMKKFCTFRISASGMWRNYSPLANTNQTNHLTAA